MAGVAERNIWGLRRGKKLREHYRWYLDKKRIEYCDTCGGGKEKCLTCEYARPPALMENNFDAWAVWAEIQTQFRAGPTGIIGLDYSEMRQAIRDFGLTRTRSLEKKIKALEKEKLIHGNSRSK